MLYKYNDAHIDEIESTSFHAEGILERQHLQTALKEKISVIAPECLVIAEEFSEWDESRRRIDLLAIDKNANLVVIELKRDDTGEHMELQAMRYSAMISTLTYERIIEIYEKYLEQQGIQESGEDKLLEFLEWEEPREEEFALDVRIILVSSNFSKEITTTVMWLNERNLDIRCVRMQPYIFNGSILIDVQQVIPLPEAEEYQVRLREKSKEKRQARQSSRDYTKYRFNNTLYNKRKLVLAVVHTWVNDNEPDTLDDLLAAFPNELRKNGAMFVPYKEALDVYERQQKNRHFLNEDELIIINGSTYAVSNQWGKGNIENFVKNARELGYEIAEMNE
ncbi:hypothetical protein [Salibacterium halotolerans]|uniref:DUF91 domain-containing protein n=1 Tax=Salibacterium halotolerans TaxID=1884432 RepID=A0A1I5Y304_9BACI|nr:hypothetical protein [Salibacterium halotolerans]SFQ38632.1 hypothetical protein SAMN05518683_1351 [Salibacterium halotolerans]